MNFNLGELESLFNEIKRILNYIEETNFCERKFDIYLSNGDKLTYKLNKDSIAHLLGINIDYFRSTSLFKNSSSYELLKELIEEPYKINDNVQKGIMHYNFMFSEFILDKVKIFLSNIKLNTDETELVCKYDIEKSYYFSKTSRKYDYIFIKKHKNNTYTLLGLVKKNGIYLPMSGMYFQDYESLSLKLKGLINNQEITIFSGVRSYNDFTGYSSSYVVPLNDKINKINNMLKYKKDFNCIIDCTKDFRYLLADSLKSKGQFYEDINLVDSLVNSINNNELINVEEFEGSKLIDVANAFNDYLCVNNSNNEVIGETYTDVTKERDTLRNELLAMKTEVEKLNKEKLELINENKEIKKMNEDYKSREEAMLRILKPGS